MNHRWLLLVLWVMHQSNSRMSAVIKPRGTEFFNTTTQPAANEYINNTYMNRSTKEASTEVSTQDSCHSELGDREKRYLPTHVAVLYPIEYAESEGTRKTKRCRNDLVKNSLISSPPDDNKAAQLLLLSPVSETKLEKSIRKMPEKNNKINTPIRNLQQELESINQESDKNYHITMEMSEKNKPPAKPVSQPESNGMINLVESDYNPITVGEKSARNIKLYTDGRENIDITSENSFYTMSYVKPLPYKKLVEEKELNAQNIIENIKKLNRDIIEKIKMNLTEGKRLKENKSNDYNLQYNRKAKELLHKTFFQTNHTTPSTFTTNIENKQYSVSLKQKNISSTLGTKNLFSDGVGNTSSGSRSNDFIHINVPHTTVRKGHFYNNAISHIQRQRNYFTQANITIQNKIADTSLQPESTESITGEISSSTSDPLRYGTHRSVIHSDKAQAKHTEINSEKHQIQPWQENSLPMMENMSLNLKNKKKRPKYLLINSLESLEEEVQLKPDDWSQYNSHIPDARLSQQTGGESHERDPRLVEEVLPILSDSRLEYQLPISLLSDLNTLSRKHPFYHFWLNLLQRPLLEEPLFANGKFPLHPVFHSFEYKPTYDDRYEMPTGQKFPLLEFSSPADCFYPKHHWHLSPNDDQLFPTLSHYYKPSTHSNALMTTKSQDNLSVSNSPYKIEFPILFSTAGMNTSQPDIRTYQQREPEEKSGTEKCKCDCSTCGKSNNTSTNNETSTGTYVNTNTDNFHLTSTLPTTDAEDILQEVKILGRSKAFPDKENKIVYSELNTNSPPNGNNKINTDNEELHNKQTVISSDWNSPLSDVKHQNNFSLNHTEYLGLHSKNAVNISKSSMNIQTSPISEGAIMSKTTIFNSTSKELDNEEQFVGYYFTFLPDDDSINDTLETIRTTNEVPKIELEFTSLYSTPKTIQEYVTSEKIVENSENQHQINVGSTTVTQNYEESSITEPYYPDDGKVFQDIHTEFSQEHNQQEFSAVTELANIFVSSPSEFKEEITNDNVSAIQKALLPNIVRDENVSSASSNFPGNIYINTQQQSEQMLYNTADEENSKSDILQGNLITKLEKIPNLNLTGYNILGKENGIGTTTVPKNLTSCKICDYPNGTRIVKDLSQNESVVLQNEVNTLTTQAQFETNGRAITELKDTQQPNAKEHEHDSSITDANTPYGINSTNYIKSEVGKRHLNEKDDDHIEHKPFDQSGNSSQLNSRGILRTPEITNEETKTQSLHKTFSKRNEILSKKREKNFLVTNNHFVSNRSERHKAKTSNSRYKGTIRDEKGKFTNDRGKNSEVSMTTKVLFNGKNITYSSYDKYRKKSNHTDKNKHMVSEAEENERKQGPFRREKLLYENSSDQKKNNVINLSQVSRHAENNMDNPPLVKRNSERKQLWLGEHLNAPEKTHEFNDIEDIKTPNVSLVNLPESNKITNQRTERSIYNPKLKSSQLLPDVIKPTPASQEALRLKATKAPQNMLIEFFSQLNSIPKRYFQTHENVSPTTSEDKRKKKKLKKRKNNFGRKNKTKGTKTHICQSSQNSDDSCSSLGHSQEDDDSTSEKETNSDDASDMYSNESNTNEPSVNEKIKRRKNNIKNFSKHMKYRKMPSRFESESNGDSFEECNSNYSDESEYSSASGKSDCNSVRRRRNPKQREQRNIHPAYTVNNGMLASEINLLKSLLQTMKNMV